MPAKKRPQVLEASNTSTPPKRIPEESDQDWRRLARRRNRLVVCFLVGESCGLALLYVLLHITSRSPLVWPVLFALSMSAGGGLGGGWLALRYQSQLVEHVRQTLQNKQIRSLGCWIDLLFASGAQACNNGEWDQPRAEARAGLRECLPLLTEETAPLLLRAHDRRALYKALKGQNKELIAAVLQIVPLLGDACALPYVERLAAGKGMAGKHSELQAEAQSVLPRLQARLALSSDTAGLLRASQPPPEPQAELLLPATANNETAPGELLRAENRK
jgi:hypothetical protein